MNQCPRDLETAAHSAGIGRDQVVGAVAQADQVKQPPSALMAGPARNIVKGAVNIDILPSREVQIGSQRLRYYPDALADPSRMPGDIVARDGSLAAAGREQSSEHPDQRGFAGAVGTEQ